MTPQEIKDAEAAAARGAELTVEIDATLAIKADKSVERAACWRTAHELGMTLAEIADAAGVNPSQVDKAIKRPIVAATS